MKNALSELQALDMHGHKATPDVVLDTLDNRTSMYTRNEQRKSEFFSARVFEFIFF